MCQVTTVRRFWYDDGDSVGGEYKRACDPESRRFPGEWNHGAGCAAARIEIRSGGKRAISEKTGGKAGQLESGTKSDSEISICKLTVSNLLRAFASTRFNEFFSKTEIRKLEDKRCQPFCPPLPF